MIENGCCQIDPISDGRIYGRFGCGREQTRCKYILPVSCVFVVCCLVVRFILIACGAWQGECASVCNDLRMDVLTLSMCRCD